MRERTEEPARTPVRQRLIWTIAGFGTLAIDNLTNRDYSEPFGYQALQRVIRAGLRVTY